MSALLLDLIVGFAAALAVFGGVLALVYWLYRLAFGQPLKIPLGSFSSLENAWLAGVFALMLAGGLLYLYNVAATDWSMRRVFTLTYTQPIDYFIASLVLMPPLFWFGGSLLAGRRAQPAAQMGEVHEGEGVVGVPEPESREAGGGESLNAAGSEQPAPTPPGEADEGS